MKSFLHTKDFSCLLRSAALAALLFTGGELSAQDKKINLVVNGDFEKGRQGFSSEYEYSRNYLGPGLFTITGYAPSLNKDYRNPIEGDHTSGTGNYLLVDADGTSGKKAWYTTVEVIPNSNYTFSIFFCNLYKHRGSDMGFQINGLDIAGGHPKQNDCKVKFTVANEQAGETEVDIFHLFHWVKATAVWYSGTHSGKVDIAIENMNYNASGNDMAIDDVEFSYIETMPKGYKPPEKKTIMIAGNKVYTEERYRLQNDAESPDANGIYAGDSIAPGIYTMYGHRKPKSDSLSKAKPQKIILKDLIFAQGSSVLDSSAQQELNKLVKWMKQNSSVRIRLEGHTENVGKPEANQSLSENRVYSVKDYLVGAGIKDSRIETKAYGGAYPVTTGSDEEVRKLNRRVEIEILD